MNVGDKVILTEKRALEYPDVGDSIGIITEVNENFSGVDFLTVKFPDANCGEVILCLDEEDLILLIDESEEAIENLMDVDREMKRKADLYDRILETLFMSCSMFRNGEETKYMFPPEETIEAILSIVLDEDYEEAVEKVIENKKTEFYNIRTGQPLSSPEEGGEW